MSTDDDRNPDLAAPLAALRAAMEPLQAPERVERDLMAAFGKQFPPRPWYRTLSPARWGIAGAAAGTVLVALLALSLHAPGPAGVGLAAAGDDEQAFIALESAERIAEETDAHMLATDLPRTALAQLGLPLSPENAGDMVRAELLVGADGSPLALRLVSLP